MSDPIKDLENFSHDADPMHPLPASEVRRRGDRMRRRNNGATALGAAAAAVAVIAATGFLLPGGADRGDGPAPAVDPSTSQTTESASLTSLPADFPLDAGLSGVKDSPTAGMADLDYCGTTPLSNVEPRDVRTVVLSGGEAGLTRTLYLLEDDQAALDSHTAILNAGRDCAASEDRGPRDTGEIVLRDQDSWPGSTVIEDRGPSPTEPTVTIVNVASAGQVLLVTSDFGSWHDDLDAGVADTRGALDPLLTAMGDFGDFSEPSGQAKPGEAGTATAQDPADETDTAEAPADIAAGFPLAAGWPDDSVAESDDVGLEGPNRTLQPIEFQACGKAWAEPEFADRLRADWTNPEDYRSRQLTTYAEADAAVAAVADLVAQQKACPKDPERDDGFVNVRTVRKVEVGGEGWLILERDTMDGQESPFGATTLVVRTGSAVLVIRHDGQAGYPNGNGKGQEKAMTVEASEAIAAMCTFTEAGC